MDRPSPPRNEVARSLFLVASTREPGQLGNTEWLARESARGLPASGEQRWIHLARLAIPPFVDLRHTTGSYPPPTGDLALLLHETLASTDLVFVSPVYWYGTPAPLKAYVDHWSGWMRTPGVEFKATMARKSLAVITTSGDREKAQPMIDSLRLCAEFLGMRWRGALWGKGGPPGAVEQDGEAVRVARGFLRDG